MRVDPRLQRLCARGTLPVPSTLVVAAHADDETIGAGALLSHVSGSCWVAHVTDGAPQDRRFFPDSAARLSRAAYARMRTEEAQQALSVAGVDASRMSQLGVRDQDASYDMASLALAIEALLETLKPEVVLTHPYEGGHPDHDATAFGVHSALRRRKATAASGDEYPLLVEMTSYHDVAGTTVRGEFLPARDAEEITLDLTEEERKRKRAMFAAFASQRDVLGAFVSERERFRAAPTYDFNLPPHDGRLHYERFQLGMAGATWRALARAATKKLGLRGAPR